MAGLRVENVRLESGAERQTLTADFVVGRKTKQVWFRTDKGPLNATGDPFLPVALIPAMRRGWSVAIGAPVSASLLQGIDTIQEVMSGWYPDFQQVDVRVSDTPDVNGLSAGGVATFFSGGVDSFYTLLQHREEITHLIFVHGFDIPLGNPLERERAAASVRDVAVELGLGLVEVETNLRQFGQAHISWVKAFFGAGLGAVALLLAPRFKRVFLPASVSSDQLMPMGSHPDLDPYWRNEQMQLLHDGLEATRFEKIRQIGAWQTARDNLRVCYQKNSQHLNCGHCRKCLWTMMMLKATGDLEKVRTFASPLDLRELRLYPPVPKYERDRFEEAIRLLQERAAEPEFRRVLQEMLEANGHIPLAGRIKRLLTRVSTYLAHHF